MRRARLILAALALLAAIGAVGLMDRTDARAEYGDIILNDRSEAGGMRPVIFPHWFHRSRFQCRVCHSELGFEMRVGANRIAMADLYYGRFCAECHNGQTAWSIDNCGLCHSGRMGLETGVHGRHRTTGPGRW